MESIATPDNAHGKETYCHCENESIGRYVAFGSARDERHRPPSGPNLGVQPMKIRESGHLISMSAPGISSSVAERWRVPPLVTTSGHSA